MVCDITIRNVNMYLKQLYFIAAECWCMYSCMYTHAASMKSSSKSHTLNKGQYLEHYERRTADNESPLWKTVSIKVVSKCKVLVLP